MKSINSSTMPKRSLPNRVKALRSTPYAGEEKRQRTLKSRFNRWLFEIFFLNDLKTTERVCMLGKFALGLAIFMLEEKIIATYPPLIHYYQGYRVYAIPGIAWLALLFIGVAWQTIARAENNDCGRRNAAIYSFIVVGGTIGPLLIRVSPFLFGAIFLLIGEIINAARLWRMCDAAHSVNEETDVD